MHLHYETIDEFHTVPSIVFDSHSIFKVSAALRISQQTGLPESNPLWKTERAAIPRYEPAYLKRAVVCSQGGAEDVRLCFVNGLKPLGIWSFTDNNLLIPK